MEIGIAIGMLAWGRFIIVVAILVVGHSSHPTLVLHSCPRYVPGDRAVAPYGAIGASTP